MPLTKKDLDAIAGVVDSRLDSKLAPVHLMMQRHEQMLVGPNGDNGLKGDTEKLKECQDKMEIEVARLSTRLKVYASAIGGGIVLALEVGKEFFKTVIMGR